MSSYSMSYTSSNKIGYTASGYGRVYIWGAITNWNDAADKVSFTWTVYCCGTAKGDTYQGPWGYGFNLAAAYSYGGKNYHVDGTNSWYNYATVRSDSTNVSIAKTTSSQTVTLILDHDSKEVSGYGAAPSSILWDWKTMGTVTVSALASYTISYNANGGSGAPSSGTKYYGKTYTLSSTIPTRDGYTFAGWATSSSATSASYATGAKYTGNANLTLYAVWKQSIKTATIQYNTNGGTLAPASQTHYENKSTTLSLLAPRKEGYYFVGWATTPSTSVPEYERGDSYSNPDIVQDQIITLYAVYEKLSECYIWVPTGQSVDSIKVNIPEGKEIEGIYFWMGNTVLLDSNGDSLLDNNGNVLLAYV